MSMEIEHNATEWRSHLSRMMSMEKQSGEFLLASVVQDSLLYNLNHHVKSDTLLEIAHLAAEMAIETAAAEMSMNTFAVTESIRGVMHTMVTLGGGPEVVTVAITTGALSGIQRIVPMEEVAEYSSAIVTGLIMAADDLGLTNHSIQRIAEHIIEHSHSPHPEVYPEA